MPRLSPEQPSHHAHWPAAGRRWAVGLAALILVAPAALGAVVEGQIFDRKGSPLSGVPVRVVERTGGGPFPSLAEPEREVEVAHDTSDSRGFFRIDLGPRAFRGQVVVRCYDPRKWDVLRYAPSEDRDITRALSDRDHVVVTLLIEDAKGWPALAREISRVGGQESDRGRILRRYGMPPETVIQKDGQAEWRYQNVVYVFRDGVLVDTRRPVLADRPPAGTPSPTGGKGSVQ